VNEATAPAGKPLAESATTCVVPETRFTCSSYVAVAPGAMLALAEPEIARAKSNVSGGGGGELMTRSKVSEWEIAPLVPWMVIV